MNIYSYLTSINKYNIRYVKKYIKFIEYCQSIELATTNVHRHHILPKSLFPEFRDLRTHKWNEVILPVKHHRFAHLLLAKAFPCSNMLCALALFNIKSDIIGTNWYNDGELNYRLHKKDAEGLSPGRVSVDIWENKTYVSKDGINKSIKISELTRYLENGWQKKLIKENVVLVTNGVFNTAIKKLNVDYFLATNPEFKKGYIVLSNRRFRGNSKIFYHPATQTEARVLDYEEASFIQNGWIKGRSSQSKHNCSLAAIQINKNGKGKRVRSDMLQSYLTDGWEIGIPLEFAIANKTKALGKYRVYKGADEKLIAPSTLAEYEANGWTRGRSPKFTEAFASSIAS